MDEEIGVVAVQFRKHIMSKCLGTTPTSRKASRMCRALLAEQKEVNRDLQHAVTFDERYSLLGLLVEKIGPVLAAVAVLIMLVVNNCRDAALGRAHGGIIYFRRVRRQCRRQRDSSTRIFTQYSRKFPTAMLQLPSTTFAFPAGNKRVRFSDTSIPKQLDDKLQELASVQGRGCHGLYLVHDLGASRNLLCGTSSPLLSHLTNRRPSPPGSVVVDGGRLLPCYEEGDICGITFTTVKDLHYESRILEPPFPAGSSTLECSQASLKLARRR
jgi:hypothetical protein